MTKRMSARNFYSGASVLIAMLIALVFAGTGCKQSDTRGHTAVPKGPPSITFFDRFYDIAVSGEQIWLVGYFGKIVHSSDGGTTWMAQTSGTSRALLGICMVDDKKGWAAGDVEQFSTPQTAARLGPSRTVP